MRVMDQLYRLSIWRDTRGQDLVEYSLLTGFIAVAAGAAFPPPSPAISRLSFRRSTAWHSRPARYKSRSRKACWAMRWRLVPNPQPTGRIADLHTQREFPELRQFPLVEKVNIATRRLV